MGFFSFLFGKKIKLSSGGITQMDDFLCDLRQLDMSDIHTESEALKILLPLSREPLGWVSDEEQTRLSKVILHTLRVITERTISDRRLTEGEFIVWKHVYDDLEKFTEEFTINISKEEKNEVHIMFADIYDLKGIDTSGLRRVVIDEAIKDSRDKIRVEEKKEDEYIASLSKEEKTAYLTELSRKNYESAGLEYNPTIDKRVPFCPNCSEHIEKIPDRKKKCPHCSKQIYTYAKEVSPGKWERHLTGEEEGSSHYAAIEEERRKWEEEHNSPEYINDKIDKIHDMGCTRAIIQGSGCDRCRDKMRSSVTLATARKMIGQKLSDQCDCPYFFMPDLESR